VSAAPLNPDDIGPEVKQAGIAGLLGMMGMTVKIILTDEKLSIGRVIGHLVVACAVAILSGFALEEYIQNKKMLWALNGLSGYMALQIVAWAEDTAKKKLQATQAGIVGKPKKEKANAKRPAKRKR
jgi:lysylphosphatidylglycerol synthetase-like protein (DUF2156 family)